MTKNMSILSKDHFTLRSGWSFTITHSSAVSVVYTEYAVGWSGGGNLDSDESWVRDQPQIHESASKLYVFVYFLHRLIATPHHHIVGARPRHISRIRIKMWCSVIFVEATYWKPPLHQSPEFLKSCQ